MPPLAVLLGLEDGLHLRVAGGPIHLLFCCALLCQRVSSLIARQVVVGWYFTKWFARYMRLNGMWRTDVLQVLGMGTSNICFTNYEQVFCVDYSQVTWIVSACSEQHPMGVCGSLCGRHESVVGS